MKFTTTDKFYKEFKKLSRKYISLEEDFGKLKKALIPYPEGNGTKHWKPLKTNEERTLYIVKVRLIIKSVQGVKGRVVYFYNQEKDEIIFIEIYTKMQKDNEDKKRVEEFWKNCCL